MSNWITVNLPWYTDNDQHPEYLEYPDHDQQIKEIFGSEYDELKAKLDTGYDPSSPVYLTDEEFDELVKQGDTRAVMIARYRKLHRQIQDWEDQQLDNQEIQNKNAEIQKLFKEKELENPPSFSHSLWCRPGVLIEFETEKGIIVHQLLGHMNTLGGVCDDCRGISNEKIIKRCQVVWEQD